MTESRMLPWIDSPIAAGLPDSSSTTSSTSPPGQQTMTVDTAAHRKSSSLDNINLPGDPTARPGWKSYSLQRSTVPPTEEEAARLQAETMVIMRNGGPPGHPSTVSQPPTSLPEEDPYGRCTNMRLTSFTESSGAGPRDPRIIDLAQSTALSNGHNGQGGAYLPTSSSVPTSSHTMPVQGSNCHTLPAQGLAQYPGHPGPQSSHPHNTLPARVGESPPRGVGSHNGGVHHGGGGGHNNGHGGPHYPNHPPNLQPTGRHFKPFDHRKMNPMAEIQVNLHTRNFCSDNLLKLHLTFFCNFA